MDRYIHINRARYILRKHGLAPKYIKDLKVKQEMVKTIHLFNLIEKYLPSNCDSCIYDSQK